MTLGVLMPDLGMRMFIYDPIIGQSYIQGGAINAHRDNISKGIVRLLSVHQEGMNKTRSQRSLSIGLLKKELYDSLNGLPIGERVEEFNNLYELYYELRNEHIDRMLDSL